MQTTTTKESLARRHARTWREYIGLALRGVAMGASDVVPGVSGGTMAFILGIYEELIDSIRTLGRPEFLGALVRLHLKEAFQILNWKFLAAVGLGIGLAILSLARILEYLLENQPVYLWSFFFGLVVASVFTVSKRVRNWAPSIWGALAVGTTGAFLLVGLVPAETPESWWFLIISGMLAICAMILPGISGAFILVLLGKYQFVLGTVNGFIDGVRAADVGLVLQNFTSIALIGIGAVVGIVTLAQILGWLFNHYHDLTVALLIGLMVGSLRKIWPWKADIEWLRDTAGELLLRDGHPIVVQQENYLPTLANNGVTEILFALVLALAGLGAVLLIERLANEK